MQKKQKTILISLGVLALILLVAGFSYQLGKKQTLPALKTAVPPVLRASVLEESKVVLQRWANAVGEVTAIEDRTITLTKDGDSLTIPIAEGIGVRIAVPGAEHKAIEFQDIKLGDQVAIHTALLPGDKFEGRDVVVFPPPPSPLPLE